jgi:hypothetical protein
MLECEHVPRRRRPHPGSSGSTPTCSPRDPRTTSGPPKPSRRLSADATSSAAPPTSPQSPRGVAERRRRAHPRRLRRAPRSDPRLPRAHRAAGRRRRRGRRAAPPLLCRRHRRRAGGPGAGRSPPALLRPGRRSHHYVNGAGRQSELVLWSRLPDTAADAAERGPTVFYVDDLVTLPPALGAGHARALSGFDQVSGRRPLTATSEDLRAFVACGRQQGSTQRPTRDCPDTASSSRTVLVAGPDAFAGPSPTGTSETRRTPFCPRVRGRSAARDQRENRRSGASSIFIGPFAASQRSGARSDTRSWS